MVCHWFFRASAKGALCIWLYSNLIQVLIQLDVLGSQAKYCDLNISFHLIDVVFFFRRRHECIDAPAFIIYYNLFTFLPLFQAVQSEFGPCFHQCQSFCSYLWHFFYYWIHFNPFNSPVGDNSLWMFSQPMQTYWDQSYYWFRGDFSQQCFYSALSFDKFIVLEVRQTDHLLSAQYFFIYLIQPGLEYSFFAIGQHIGVLCSTLGASSYIACYQY